MYVHTGHNVSQLCGHCSYLTMVRYDYYVDTLLQVSGYKAIHHLAKNPVDLFQRIYHLRREQHVKL